MKKQTLIAAGVVLLGAAAATWSLRRGMVDGAGATNAALPATSFRFAIPAGTRIDYDVRLGTEQRVVQAGVPGAPDATEAQLHLDGGLALRSYGREGDRLRVGVVFTRIDHASLRVLGADALASVDAARAMLTDREAIVEMNDRGEVQSIGVRRDDPDTFKSVVHAVVQAFAVTAPREAASRWTAEERAMLGRARSRYVTMASDPLRWERTREAYVTLASAPQGKAEGVTALDKTTVHLAPEGHLLALDTHEEVTAKTPSMRAVVDFALTRTATGTFEGKGLLALAPGELEKREPGQALSPADVRRRLFEQAAGEIRLDEITSRVAALGGSSAIEDGWMTRAVAYLSLHPDDMPALVRVFEARETSPRARGYVLDLLRSVGTKEAQAAMRTALASPAARAVPGEYPVLLQKLSLLQRPELETVRFVEGAVDGARDEHERRAALFALGSTAGARQRSSAGHDVDAQIARVTNELARATSEEDKKAAVAALGNAGTKDVPRLLAPHVKDASAPLRSEIATALRKVKTPETRGLLTTLAADRDATVSQAALRTLEDQPLAREDLSRVADAVTAPAFARGADGAVLGLASRHLDEREVAERMLRAVVARNGDTPKVQARARQLLAQIAGGT